MGKRPGAKYMAVHRLDSLMAIGDKRSEAKAAAQRRGESLKAWTDGKMRSFETRRSYQKIDMRFMSWCQHTCDLHDPEVIDLFANRLVTQFLRQRLEEGKSAWTLQTERSALRQFFGDRLIADELELPKRRRKDIKRSRLPAKRDTQINLNNGVSASKPENCTLRLGCADPSKRKHRRGKSSLRIDGVGGLKPASAMPNANSRWNARAYGLLKPTSSCLAWSCWSMPFCSRFLIRCIENLWTRSYVSSVIAPASGAKKLLHRSTDFVGHSADFGTIIALA